MSSHEHSRERKNLKRGPSKFDIRHKETLRLFLREYFELFFPDLVPVIRFDTARFLDKELISLFGKSDEIEGAEDQSRITDALVLIEALWKDEPELSLIHWEQQGEKEEGFSERMFHYFCGIYYKFRMPIFPVAMFTDPAKWRKPVEEKFTIRFRQYPVNEYSFCLIKLKKHTAKEFEKISEQNPLASAYLPLTDYPRKERPVIKAKAIKGISGMPEGIRKSTLYSLIDVSLELNEEEQKRFKEIIRDDPDYKEVKMLETIEEVGIEKGIEQGIEKGIEQGIEKGILIGQILLAHRLINEITYSHEELQNKTVDELREIFAWIEQKLKYLA